MRAVCVCVDYSEFLKVTYPCNRHHFESITVVTCPRDIETLHVCDEYGIDFYVTNSFYDDGALFNKWKALEEGLDYIGRQGWLCMLDPDVVWPGGAELELRKEFLYAPYRRMHLKWKPGDPLPPESKWLEFPRHKNVGEWVGYSQIYHAEDSHLPDPPWYDVTFTHAGVADSLLQRRWPKQNKIRPNFEVLHLGENGRNWAGVGKEKQLKEMIKSRHKYRGDKFQGERLK